MFAQLDAVPLQRLDLGLWRLHVDSGNRMKPLRQIDGEAHHLAALLGEVVIENHPHYRRRDKIREQAQSVDRHALLHRSRRGEPQADPSVLDSARFAGPVGSVLIQKALAA
ncbi:MAG: hypothetical protein ACREA0_31885 [bacterium]